MPTTTKYIWDDDNLLAEADGTDAIHTVYTNEPEQYGNLISSRIGGATSYHEFDALGSTRQLTNLAGSTTDTSLYDAWGNVVTRTGATPTAVLWVGEMGYYTDVETGSMWVRARTYRSALGRWASMDPLMVRIRAEPYVYSGNSPMTALDPSGLVKVVGLTPASDALNLTCGKRVAAKWDFLVDFVDDEGKTGAPCDGYLVQEVTVKCNVKDCGRKSLGLKTFVYYEAWPVTKGSPEIDGHKKGQATDTAAYTPSNGLCGTVNQDGEVRFYCKAGATGTGDLSKEPGWDNNKKYGTNTKCDTSPRDLISFDGGTGTTKPTFWSNTNGITKPASRSYELRFCCCPDKKQNVNLVFSPKKVSDK